MKNVGIIWSNYFIYTYTQTNSAQQLPFECFVCPKVNFAIVFSKKKKKKTRQTDASVHRAPPSTQIKWSLPLMRGKTANKTQEMRERGREWVNLILMLDDEYYTNSENASIK